MKLSDIQFVLSKFNSFHKNLKFIFDSFPNSDVHFLDLKISGVRSDVYRKYTHAGQDSHFSSFEPFSRKTAWINSGFSCHQNLQHSGTTADYYT